METSKYGYKVGLVARVPARLKCPFCNLLVRNAIQTFRGERACATCYIEAKGEGNICPIDNEPIEKDEFFIDVYAIRESLQLLCYCNNKENGCSWQGTVNEVQQHEATCMNIPIECPYLCKQPEVTLGNLYEHVGKCPKVNAGNTCPYKLVGCKYQPQSLEDLDNHLEHDRLVHAALTVIVVNSAKNVNDCLKEEIKREQTIRINLSQEAKDCCNKSKSIAMEMTSLKDRLCDKETEVNTLLEMCDNAFQTIEENQREAGTLMDDVTSVTDIEAKIAAISSKQKQLNSLINQFDGGGKAAGHQEMAKLMSTVSNVENQNALVGVDIHDLHLKLQLLELTTYNGQLLWKIENIHHLINQAALGEVIALHSAPCYKRKNSYKFCTRLYLNGDGKGEGTHVSLFIVLMKSDCDALLDWPFIGRVSFCLINPYNKDESIRETFLTDKDSASYKRPTKEMNISAGCPMFVRKEKFLECVIDNTVLIETTVS